MSQIRRKMRAKQAAKRTNDRHPVISRGKMIVRVL